MAGALAEARIYAERNRYDAELANLRAGHQLIVNMVTPLLRVLELGPFEEIVSVAIRMPDGDIRVVSV